MRKWLLFILTIVIISFLIAACKPKADATQKSPEVKPAAESPQTVTGVGIAEVNEVNKELSTSELDKVDKDLEQLNW